MMIKRSMLIMSLAMISIQTFAQTDNKLYFRNDIIVDSIAEEIVSSTPYIKIEDQPSYKKAIGGAFESYWKNKKVKNKFSIQELEKRQSQIQDFRQQIESLNNSIDSLNNLISETLSEQKRLTDSLSSISEEEYVVPLDPEIEELKKSIHNDSIRLAELSEQIQTLETVDLKSAQEDVNRMRTIILEDSTRIGENTEKLNGYYGDDSPTAQFQNTIGRLQTYIEELGVLSDKQLGEINVEMLKETITLFDGSSSLLQSVDELQYKALRIEIDKMRPMLPVAEKMQQGVRLMAGRFNNEKNQGCAKELAELAKMAKNNLTNDQRKELDGVIKALNNQQSSFMNINFLLEMFLEQDFQSSDFDIDEFTSLYLSFVEPDTKAYNPYYQSFRTVLETLISDVKSGELSRKGNIAQYIDNLKNKL